MYLIFLEGLPKPTSIEQPTLIGMVVGFVQNFLPDFSAAEIIWVRSMKASKFGVFNVQCRSVVSATRVKSTFASIVKSSTKPSYIGDVSISFAHTIGTRVRISLMRAISKRQKEKDTNAICSVSAFTSRPLLRVGGKDQGTRFLSFVDAIAGFRHLLTQADLDRALSLCSGQKGRLKSKYLVLSDDRVLPPYQNPRKQQQAGAQQQSGHQGQARGYFTSGGQQQAAHASVPVPQHDPNLAHLYPAPQGYSQPPPLPSFGSNPMSVPGGMAGQPFIHHYLQATLPGLAMLPHLQPGAYVPAIPSQAPPPAIAPQQQVVTADVHASPAFVKVTRKRVRKAAAAATSKRSTPMRKAKGQQDQSSQEVNTEKAEHLNKSSNMEDFASCGEESEVDMTEAIEVVGAN